MISFRIAAQGAISVLGGWLLG